MTRVVYVHGNQTTHWSFAWAANLQSALSELGYETFFETMPDSILAREEYWLPFLKDHVGVNASDILVGISSGAVAAMRYAETNQVLGSVLIAPCCTDLDDEMERQSGYFNRPWNWDAIRNNQKAIYLITSADDPYIPQEEFETIADTLKPERIQFETEGHFMDRTSFPEVVEAVKTMAPLN